MRVTAMVRNGASGHEVVVATDQASRALAIPAKAAGRGSAVNGGELLVLALATCYCNDLYREADRLGISIDGIEVEAHADFDGPALAARDIHYTASVRSPAPAERIEALLRETDAVAEIHNTVRKGVAVTLRACGD